jgi:hypothetical protein
MIELPPSLKELAIVTGSCVVESAGGEGLKAKAEDVGPRLRVALAKPNYDAKDLRAFKSFLQAQIPEIKEAARSASPLVAKAGEVSLHNVKLLIAALNEATKGVA